MARDGWWFVGPSLVICALGAAGAVGGGGWGWPVAILGGLATIAFAFFFRDPDRIPPDDPDAIIATADGTILSVDESADGRLQIDTFLSVLNVHVNRAPVSGTVTESVHHSGSFHLAYQPKAGKANERHDLTIAGALGSVRSAQIAGTLARRIVCRPQPGDTLLAGERIGLIKFGSRAQVILERGFVSTVKPGDKVRAGETILARRVSSGGVERAT